jgi:predicted nuclease of predicted toxin-antitoxin system
VKVLLDECAPRALKRVMESNRHTCVTVQDAGWAGKKNGELPDLAEREFDVFVTIDSRLRYQQSLQRAG